MIKKIFLGITFAAGLSAAAFAGGIFDNYPIVGGSSFCAATTNGVCVTTVPAGPSAITGNEAIPADTNLSGGANPQTVQITTTTLKNYMYGGTAVGTATATTGAATSNTGRGTITSESLTTAAGATYTLTLTNSLVSASSIILASVSFGSATAGTPTITTVTPGSGSVVIVVQNIHASAALNGTIKVNYAIVN